MTEPDSSSSFLIRLNAGTESAIEQVDRRYRERLCALVEREMGRRFAAREDAEDPVQSAMWSFYRGVREKRFQIDQSAALWRLLVKMTRTKVAKHVERNLAAKRRPTSETPVVDAELPGSEPDPADVVCAADLIERAIDGLEPPGPEIFRLRLEGCTRAEIAKQVRCTEASVRMTLDRIRDRLNRLTSR